MEPSNLDDITREFCCGLENVPKHTWRELSSCMRHRTLQKQKLDVLGARHGRLNFSSKELLS